MEIITFGQFGNKINLEEERKLFLKVKKELVRNLSSLYITYEFMEKKNETEIDELIEELKKEKKTALHFETTLDIFMNYMGLSFIGLNKEEREEIVEMKFTYENWKKKSLSLLDNFTEKCKRDFPPEFHICFQDIWFIIYIQAWKDCVVNLKSLLKYIRNYYILDNLKSVMVYRDQEMFEKIRNNMINIYPQLKEKYGMNRTLEKFLSYLYKDNDYNIECVSSLLNKYYENKSKINQDEFIGLKQKED